VYLTCSKKLTGSQLSLPHGERSQYYIKFDTRRPILYVHVRLPSACRYDKKIKML